MNCMPYFVNTLTRSRSRLCRGQNSEKSETDLFSFNHVDILITFGIHNDLDKKKPKGLPNVIYHWSKLCQGPKSDIF